VDLLREVVLQPHFIDLMELSFDPVDVALFVDHDVLEQLPRGVILRIEASFDSRLEYS
jgi:hypothetical protein